MVGSGGVTVFRFDRRRGMIATLETATGPDPGALAAGSASAPDRPDSFEAAYRESRDDLYSYVAGLLRDQTAAEDVTALTFERAFRKWHRFNPARGTARGWLFGIARNAALDELRKRKREVPLTREPVDVDPDSDALGRLERRDRRVALDAALDTLRPADREVISLKFFAGLSNAEIAETTGVSVTNVGTRVHRAMTRLRNACQEDLR